MSLRTFLLRFLEKEFIKRPIKALLKRIFKTPPGLIKIAMFDIRFAQFGGLTIIPRTWHEFFKKHSAEIEALFEALLSGMDEKSIETARLVWERYVTFGHLSKFTDLVYVPADSLFTEEELEAQRYVESLINKVKRDYKLPINYYDESVSIYEHGLTFVKEVLGWRLNDYLRNAIFIDGGGFVGDSLLVFQKYEPSKVIIFEPALEHIKLIERTIQLNRLDSSRVMIVKAGLSNKEHKATLYFNFIASTCEFDLKERGCHSYEIELTSLDTFCEKNREIFRDKAIRLIKLDIEGAELKAVEGAINTIRKSRPILLIAIYHKPEDFFFIKPLLEQKVENYRYFIRKFAPHSPSADTYLIGVPGDLFL